MILVLAHVLYRVAVKLLAYYLNYIKQLIYYIVAMMTIC